MTLLGIPSHTLSRTEYWQEEELSEIVRQKKWVSDRPISTVHVKGMKEIKTY